MILPYYNGKFYCRDRQISLSRINRFVVRQRNASDAMHESMSEKFTRSSDFLNGGGSVRL